MSDLTSPFVLREGDDLIAFDSLENLESAIEAYDVGKLEFFDANGRPLVATVDGYRVHLHADPEATLEPERLEAMLRSYFAGLGARQQRFARYTNAAEHVTSLQALLQLRLKLSSEPRFPLWARLCQRLGTRDDP